MIPLSRFPFLRALSFMVLLFLSRTPVISQDSTFSTIQGIVYDSASGTPLENAIIYLANTPLGGSSTIDGAFIIRDVPPGQFELVISRVDYMPATLPVTIGEADIDRFFINLTRRLIVTPEVEIVGSRLSGSVTLSMYYPITSPGVLSVYGTASTTPIAVIHADSMLLMASVDLEVVDGEKYLRLWLLLLNRSRTPHDFFPARDVRLDVTGPGRTFHGIPPEQTDWLRTVLDTGEVMAAISATVRASLESMAIQRNKYLFNEAAFLKLLALQGLLLSNMTRTRKMPASFTPARDESLSGRLYSIYEQSVNVGLIGRNLVYPDNSLHGYLYFPYPGLQWQASDGKALESSFYRYEIAISIPSGIQKIVFTPN